jgi:sulfur-oxidizing protein SoxX
VRIAPRAGARRWAIAATLVVAVASPVSGETPVAAFAVAGDAVPEPLEGRTGDGARGRQVVLDRNHGNCLICHAVPEPSERFMGELGPDLTAVGARLTAGQLRLRLIDQSRINTATVMPPYYRVSDLTRVATRYRGKPVLTAQEVEDVVAYLAGLTTK